MFSGSVNIILILISYSISSRNFYWLMSMPIFDSNGNHIDTTIFESYLSKLIVEKRDLYTSVYRKINTSICDFIELNKHDRKFDRLLFCFFSEFSNTFPGYAKIEDFLKEGFSVQAATEFHKAFFEMMFQNGMLPTNLPKKKEEIPSLSEMIQLTIFNNSELKTSLKSLLRPALLFSETNRGRKDKKLSKPVETQKLGIATEENTPQDLKYYFKKPYESAQSQFKRDLHSHFNKWLAQRNLPFVAGTSGTLDIVFRHIIQLNTYTPYELKLYFMASTAAMVSRGHHSFAEGMIVAEKIGFPIKDCSNRQRFYEQFLVQDLIDSKEYQIFFEDPFIKQYLNEYNTSCSFFQNK